VGYVSAADYERILAIVAESSRGTAEEPLPGEVLELIRVLARCDSVALFEGSPWDRVGRRVWVTPVPRPFTEAEKAIVDTYRLDVPLYPSAETMNRAVRVSDVMSQRQYRNLAIYRMLGRSLGIEFAMDYWMGGGDQTVRGLRFDASRHDFADRTRDAIEVLGRHLGTVLASHDRRIDPVTAALLTAREAEIMALVSLGRTNRQIGQALAISQFTVRKHLENAYVRIGVHSRAEAVARTYRGQPS
jgi:DNA-binding CsgD family transcriptional regulator